MLKTVKIKTVTSHKCIFILAIYLKKNWRKFIIVCSATPMKFWERGKNYLVTFGSSLLARRVHYGLAWSSSYWILVGVLLGKMFTPQIIFRHFSTLKHTTMCDFSSSAWLLVSGHVHLIRPFSVSSTTTEPTSGLHGDNSEWTIATIQICIPQGPYTVLNSELSFSYTSGQPRLESLVFPAI